VLSSTIRTVYVALGEDGAPAGPPVDVLPPIAAVVLGGGGGGRVAGGE